MRRAGTIGVALVCAGLASGCRNPQAANRSCPRPETPAPAAELREVFPHVRADLAGKLVEFDAAISPMLVPDPRAPLFFLEVVACLPDTREHETLVVSRARPSHVHAAMLLIGLRPGAPGGWAKVEDRPEPLDPTGDRVEVRFAFSDPSRGMTEADPLAWIVSASDGRSIVEHAAGRAGGSEPGWVFAGSRIVSGRRAAVARADEPSRPAEVYDADVSGTLIGLATFGAETIAWSKTFSPDANVDAPEWIAKLDAIPPAGTPVVVRIRPAR